MGEVCVRSPPCRDSSRSPARRCGCGRLPVQPCWASGRGGRRTYSRRREAVSHAHRPRAREARLEPMRRWLALVGVGWSWLAYSRKTSDRSDEKTLSNVCGRTLITQRPTQRPTQRQETPPPSTQRQPTRHDRMRFCRTNPVLSTCMSSLWMRSDHLFGVAGAPSRTW